jgi:diacylglycerol O-acyltransferase
MRRIDIADSGFLFLEKRETPMHVGGIHLLTIPPGVDEQEFLTNLLQVLRTQEEYRHPFGEYVATGRTGAFGPLYWEKDDSLDIEYHVRHSALPKPGRYRELFMLISRLHSTLLDRKRPLWEIHLIEGLPDRQFALYMKMHHAAIDGASSIHLTNSMYATNKTDQITTSPMSLAGYERYKKMKFAGRQPPRVTPKGKELNNVLDVLRQQYDSSTNLLSAFRQYGGAFFGKSGSLTVPWHNVPRTSINTKVSGARRFVAQSWDFDRIRAVCKAVDGTVNDVVLAMCSGALRRYLAAQDEHPSDSLKAMAPVSLRDENDLDSANAVGFITADLATNIQDPEKRLRKIQASMASGKALMKGLSSREAALFMQISQLPALLTSILGLAHKIPAFSTVISNVPGPKQPLFCNGASLDGIYPASIVFDGFAMNITLVSYNNKLNFGIIGCRRSLPHLQRLIDFLEESLQELEDVAGLRDNQHRAKTAAKAKAKVKTTAKAKPRPKANTKRKAGSDN